ncbi:hypothetical protein A4D02_21265 [Niastella koreensis]|uniref:DUF4136 domain-containing protein n=2 Tax=Niastella koreensis TaxID=354356 RepID=G8TJ85_NIAKG|nr:DUF4136 domain-containing protein [Niastella koreensis]AEV98618.1 hypothetical protein Niako_2267 [Niastella koreensis GR20-10]OQP52940.1 hypothetical protein A4D02_21265 [Niastella koreensis]
MKFSYFILGVALFHFLALSCSNPVHIQKDPAVNLSTYQTYSWVDTKENEQDNVAKPTAYLDISMRKTVNQQLAKKGWKETDQHPDVLISYEVLVERSTEERSNPVYTRPFTRVFYNPFRGRWINIYYPSEFLGYQTYQVPVKEGTIIISMVDANTDKVVWQGWTTRKLNYAMLTEKEIKKSVADIFKKFV